jgi:hypothetical protein
MNTHGLNLVLDTLRWDQVRLEAVHRRLSHSVTQVGSYLYIIGGHDGNSYSSDILFFNLGEPGRRIFHSERLSLSPQSRWRMRPSLWRVNRYQREDIMCPFWPTVGYSSSGGSMARTSTRTCTSWIWLVVVILRRYARLISLHAGPY